MGRRKTTKKNKPRDDTYYSSETLEVNENFIKYYKDMNIVDDWEKFIECLKSPLPTNFRITGSKSALDLKNVMMNDFFPSLQGIVIDGVQVSAPTPLSWYPNELGWQYQLNRTAIRRSPEVSKFHKFLVSETEVGSITRQEAVSMIPPLLLDVEPDHFVLDMCAAPGSKTTQIIEALHAKGDPVPGGIVIANDSNYDRSYMLVKQTKRLQSPCLMVTNHEAQHFPSIYYNDGSMSKPLTFDRILCDVPCSGDGTLRKNKAIWRSWNGNNANALHKLQIQILLRGVELLKIGGRVVYSTCSFNPVENEAVVCEVLKQCNGSIELVDVSDRLPTLKRGGGITKWNVIGKDGTTFESYQDVPSDRRRVILESAFPPTDVERMGLEKCLRVVPYVQDTGGFFVAVFEKKKSYGTFDCKPSIPISKTAEVKKRQHSDDEGSAKKQKHEKHEHGDSMSADRECDTANVEKACLSFAHPRKEADFIFLSADSADTRSVVDFYGIKEEFPKTQFLVRSNVSKKNNIYFCSKTVKEVIEARNAYKLSIVNSGIKLFARNEGKGGIECPYRICNDGSQILRESIQRRVINVRLGDLLLLLRENAPHFSQFTPSVCDKLESSGHGSLLFILEPVQETCDEDSKPKKAGALRFQVSIPLPVWRGKSSVSLLLDKQERRSLLMRLTGEEYLELKT